MLTCVWNKDLKIFLPLQLILTKKKLAMLDRSP